MVQEQTRRVPLIQDVKQKDWPRANVPEFAFKRNGCESKRKSIFIQDTGKLSLEEVLEIAKEQAQRMGMGEKSLLQVLDCPYSPKEKGWCVIVQSRL